VPRKCTTKHDLHATCHSARSHHQQVSFLLFSFFAQQQCSEWEEDNEDEDAEDECLEWGEDDEDKGAKKKLQNHSIWKVLSTLLSSNNAWTDFPAKKKHWTVAASRTMKMVPRMEPQKSGLVAVHRRSCLPGEPPCHLSDDVHNLHKSHVCFSWCQSICGINFILTHFLPIFACSVCSRN